MRFTCFLDIHQSTKKRKVYLLMDHHGPTRYPCHGTLVECKTVAQEIVDSEVKWYSN